MPLIAAPTSVRIGLRLGCLWGMVLVVATVDAQPQTTRRQQELGEVRREISRLQQQMDRLRGEAQSRSHELTRTEVELQLQRARLAEARQQRDALQSELAKLLDQTRELAEDLARTESILVASTQRLQGWTSESAARWLLMDSRGGDVERVRWLRYLVGGMNQRRAWYSMERRRLARLTAELRLRETELAEWVRREEERSHALIEAHRTQLNQLVTVRRRRDRLSSTVAELIARERRTAEFIDLLEGRSFADQTPMQRFRGLLDPPVRGQVAKGFGPQLDPRYRTRVPHNGLEYDLGVRGQAVHAIYSGEVVYAATFQGFGLTVIIAHPIDVYTLYAGLTSLRVSKGDVVALQQSVGSAGRSLYFEIRLENRPQDPAIWVR